MQAGLPRNNFKVMILNILKTTARTIPVLLLMPIYIIIAILKSRYKVLVWGSTPLLSYKYWSEAMKEDGYQSITIMEGFYKINKKSDYDRYFSDFAPSWIPCIVRIAVGPAIAFFFLLRNAKVLHTSYDGFALRRTWLWWLEGPLLSLAGVKTIVTPYGADAYIYSRIIDTSLRYGLLASYPLLARNEKNITRRLNYWNRWADVVIAGFMVDGNGRWDVTMNQIFAIDTKSWVPRETYSNANGHDGPVRIAHSPNHRGFKGTEFLISAIEQLRKEGLDIELVVLENIANDEVRQHIQRCDILAEQFIGTGYALSGIEGMALGLPVLSNLEDTAHTQVFRRYSFLSECPVISTPPESLVENLRILITNPILREQIGRAGRAYVEKYHSYKTAQYLFGSIYRKLAGENINLMELFHPLKSQYNSSLPRVLHPLIDSRLPTSIIGLTKEANHGT